MIIVVVVVVVVVVVDTTTTTTNNNSTTNDNNDNNNNNDEGFPSFRTQPLENLTPLPMNKWSSEQPSPWRKSSKRESCYGDRVYGKFSKFHVCFCGLDPGNLKYETVQTHKQHICF